MLFQLCLFCESTTVEVKKVVVGTFLKVEQRCKDCLRCRTWRSQPFIGNIPAGNLLLSSAILFSGSLPSKSYSTSANSRMLHHNNKNVLFSSKTHSPSGSGIRMETKAKFNSGGGEARFTKWANFGWRWAR